MTFYDLNDASVEHLVVDSSGFIHNGPIRETGKHIYSCQDVVDEIKDKNTRDRLAFLPYTLQLVQVDDDAFNSVVSFSKKTGDYTQLSVVDLKLAAIVYQLEKRYNGTKYINLEPKDLSVKELNFKNNGKDKKDQNNLVEQVQASLGNAVLSDQSQHGSEQSMTIDEGINQTNEDCNGELEDEADDESDWITPGNIEHVYEKMGLNKVANKTSDPTPLNRVMVACMTSDFSIQNLLLQMGLLVVSPVDGLMVKEAKKIALRCHACFKVIYDLNKLKNKFCPKCGNLDTLKRVSYVIDEDGCRKIQINIKRPIRVKGNNKQLPMPRGGKKSNDPVLAPDQKVRRDKQSKVKVVEKKTLSQAFILDDPAYLVRSNPFAQR